ncbi:MAG: nucleotidyltransferase domain-containing protein [Candidatus Dormibacteraceae bacterium]
MDEQSLERVADRLFALPNVQAVTLGGSRAVGLHRPDSDWDVGMYYRGRFEPQALRDLGWPGQVSEVGEWGGGVFNGGAWLEIDGSRVDVHYRDLESVERELSEASEGRFRIEPLLFHLAGIPTYLVVAELAVNRLVRGELPRPGYPQPLRRSAPAVWWGMAAGNLAYARDHHAPSRRVTQCVGLLAQGVCQAAHAVVAASGEWVTNEKMLVERAGLHHADRVLGNLDTEALGGAAEAALALCEAAVASAISTRDGTAGPGRR